MNNQTKANNIKQNIENLQFKKENFQINTGEYVKNLWTDNQIAVITNKNGFKLSTIPNNLLQKVVEELEKNHIPYYYKDTTSKEVYYVYLLAIDIDDSQIGYIAKNVNSEEELFIDPEKFSMTMELDNGKDEDSISGLMWRG